ncbi:CPBP family intramembrane glutamic endopeptidase [Dinghuibacter silviterrae]|nr:CPBP family intramembrane glutamic endopeptidase [Dinghuibacter silviterrae]
MRPIFGDKPLWFHCLLLAFLLVFAMALTSVLILNMPSNAYHAQALVNSLIFLLLPALFYGQLVYQAPLQESGFRSPGNKNFFVLAVVVMLVSIPMVQVLAGWNEGLHFPVAGADKWIHDTEKSQDAFQEQILNMPTPGYLGLNLLVMAFCPALGEEAFFRGVIQKILVRATRNVHVGVWLGAILFSAMHFQFLGFFPRLALGLVLGYLYAYSGSLWPSIVAHSVYNASQVIFFYAQQHQSGTHPNPVFDTNATMPLSYGLISTVLVLACFVWMKRIKTTTWP